MATVKLIQDLRRKKKDGTYPIKLIISHKRKVVYVKTPYSIESKYFNQDAGIILKGSEFIDNTRRANTNILELLNKAEKVIEELDQKNRIDRYTSDQIKKLVEKEGNESFSDDSFTNYFEKYVGEITNENTKNIYNSTLLKVNEFVSGEVLYFEDVNKKWLKSFERKLLINGRQPTTVSMDLRNIRAVFNRAIDVDEIVGQELYPFRKYEFPKTNPRKKNLTVELIRAIRDYKTDNYAVELVRDAFMLSFYLIGMNNSDVYHIDYTSIMGDRMYYNRDKTDKPYSILIYKEAKKIMKKYAGKEHLLVYPERYKNSRIYNQQLNHHLKTIGDDLKIDRLTMYHARHSWATIASELDIPKEIIAAGLGHGGNTTTDIYINFDLKKVDQANRKVIDYLNQDSK
jgi:site-specific recombinase XerD